MTIELWTSPTPNGWKWSQIDITGHPNVTAWVDRVRAGPAVERGLDYDFSGEEIDSWNQETRARYARGGASIASNESLAGDIPGHRSDKSPG